MAKQIFRWRIPRISIHSLLCACRRMSSYIAKSISVSGHIDIRGDALRGDREMIVGTGHIIIFLRGDSEYSELVASVGVGSFHDRRSQGTSKHVSVSRKQRGQGNGQIVASVGDG